MLATARFELKVMGSREKSMQKNGFVAPFSRQKSRRKAHIVEVQRYAPDAQVKKRNVQLFAKIKEKIDTANEKKQYLTKPIIIIIHRPTSYDPPR